MKYLTDWQGKSIPVPEKGENPLLGVHGFGPADTTCTNCGHFLRLPYHNNTYRKCELRQITHGKASDHKASWPACGRYQLKELHDATNE